MSVIIPECFQNVVGITREECSCLDNTDIPVDYDTSLSGLYLDELRGMDMIGLSELGGCEPEIWDLVVRNQNLAILSYRMDVMQEIMKENERRYKNFTGRIGSQDFDENLIVLNSYAGVRIVCNPMKDGVLRLKKIGLLFDGAYTFDISLYSNRQEAALYTWTVTSVADTFTQYTLPTAIELPLYDEDFEDLQYYLLYDPTGMQPKDNKVFSCCGGTGWCFNLRSPCWNDTRNIKKRWQRFLMVAGTVGDTFADRDEWATSNQMYGLTLDADTYCDAFNLLCDDQTDFADDVIDHAQATAIWYKWGEYCMDAILRSREVTRETMTNREALLGYRDFYVEQYVKNLVFVANNIDVNKSGCLHCTDRWGFGVKGDLRK